MWDNYFEDEFLRTGKVPAVVTEDGMIVLGRDDTRVKSGSNVEYDDNGNVIPITERFNSEKDDIRWSKALDRESETVRDGMDDAERARVLRTRWLTNMPKAADELSESDSLKAAGERAGVSSWNDIDTKRGKEKRALVKALAKEFGVFHKYDNADIQIEFEFTENNFRESYSKQGRRYKQFTKMFSVFEPVVENAVGIEEHLRQDYKPDPTLKKMYVLMSAFEDGDFIVPVKLEVKEFSDKENKLYVAIALEGTEKAGVWKQGNTENGVTQDSRPTVYSIPELMRKVNPSETNFTKYFPRELLTNEQREALDAGEGKRSSHVSASAASREAEIARLKERIAEDKDFLRRQTEKPDMPDAHRVTLSPAQVQRLSDKVRKNWDIAKSEEGKVKRLFGMTDDLMRTAGRNYDTVRAEMETIARELLDGVAVYDREYAARGEELRKWVKGMKLYLGADEWSDIAPDGKAEFKKQNGKYIHLTDERGTGTISVDQAYSEMLDMFPDMLDPNAVTPQDQVLEIIEAVKAREPKYVNPYGDDMSGAVDEFVNGILADYASNARTTYGTLRDMREAKRFAREVFTLEGARNSS